MVVLLNFRFVLFRFQEKRVGEQSVRILRGGIPVQSLRFQQELSFMNEDSERRKKAPRASDIATEAKASKWQGPGVSRSKGHRKLMAFGIFVIFAIVMLFVFEVI